MRLSERGTFAYCTLIEPDKQISRIRLSEKTHDVSCDTVCNFSALSVHTWGSSTGRSGQRVQWRYFNSYRLGEVVHCEFFPACLSILPVVPRGHEVNANC
jgi:hypothetical protein